VLGTVQMDRFSDRHEAGRQLARVLARKLPPELAESDLVVLGLPRGGVPVAAEVARGLNAPLDILVVRKLGLPYHPELAMGAIAEGGTRVMNPSVLSHSHVTESEIHEVELRERNVLAQRESDLRGGRLALPLEGKTALIVDDGIATGATVRVACTAARRKGAATVVVASPVMAPNAERDLTEADRIICVSSPAGFMSVGGYYTDFRQTDDADVQSILEDCRGSSSPS
jgi:putative phosphoribosyl transferase